MDIGEIWWVEFPYEEEGSTESSIRPCIIMNVDENLEVLSIKVTKHRPRDDYDIPIFKWQEANLKLPSYARVSKSLIFKQDSFLKKIGDMNGADFKNIINAFIRFHSNT
jgi:hypothetical protein